jgi:hypothetical protein
MVTRLSALCAGRFLPPGRFLVLISDRGWVDPRAIVRLEGLDKLKKSTSSGNRTGDLPACSTVPQPTTLPRALHILIWTILYITCKTKVYLEAIETLVYKKILKMLTLVWELLCKHFCCENNAAYSLYTVEDKYISTRPQSSRSISALMSFQKLPTSQFISLVTPYTERSDEYLNSYFQAQDALASGILRYPSEYTRNKCLWARHEKIRTCLRFALTVTTSDLPQETYLVGKIAKLQRRQEPNWGLGIKVNTDRLGTPTAMQTVLVPESISREGGTSRSIINNFLNPKIRCKNSFDGGGWAAFNQVLLPK